MEQPRHNPQIMREILLRRTLRAMIGAARKINRVVLGRDAFANEEQRFACLGLIRLAPAMVGWYEPEEGADGTGMQLDENGEFWRNPDTSEERKAEIRAVLNQVMTREECGEKWAESFRKTGRCTLYETEDQARQFGLNWHDKCQASEAERERDEARLRNQEREKRMRRRGRRR